MNLSALQFLSFEVGPTCNMAALHPTCPVNRQDRHRNSAGLQPLSDFHLIGFARACQSVGFCGFVAFHYYNEPLLDRERVQRLAATLRQTRQGCILWTNGGLLTASDDLASFSRVFISDHSPECRDIYAALELRFPGKIEMVGGGHDCRLGIYDQPPGATAAPCWRPSNLEMAIDYFGEVHLCCSDWRADHKIGNIQRDQAGVVLGRWHDAAQDAAQGLPEVCRRCQSLIKKPAIFDEGFRR